MNRKREKKSFDLKWKIRLAERDVRCNNNNRSDDGRNGMKQTSKLMLKVKEKRTATNSNKKHFLCLMCYRNLPCFGPRISKEFIRSIHTQHGIWFCQFGSIAILLVFLSIQNHLRAIFFFYRINVLVINCPIQCSRWKGVTVRISVCNYGLFDNALQNDPFVNIYIRSNSRRWNEKDKMKITPLLGAKKNLNQKQQQPNAVMIMMMMNSKRIVGH